MATEQEGAEEMGDELWGLVERMICSSSEVEWWMEQYLKEWGK